MPQLDMLGRPLKKAEYKTTGPFGQRKLQLGYHKVGLKPPERCETCSNLLYKCCSSKLIYKCKLIGYTASAASDIRLSFVCDHWGNEIVTSTMKEE